ncbi:MAG: hypothetical protein ACKVHD_07640 [Alphaproteobacteria bacterium]
MSVFLGIIGLVLMIFATGSVEANNFLIGFVFALLGTTTMIGSIYSQEKEKKQRIQLLIKRVDNVNKVVYDNPTMTMFNQSKLIKKLNENLYYKQ